MTVFRVPYEMRPRKRLRERPRKRGYHGGSPVTSLYSRFIKRIALDHVVPIGFETATRTFEAYSTSRQREEYRQVIIDAKDHAAYLERGYDKSDRRNGTMTSRQDKIRKRLMDFLRDQGEDGSSSPDFYK